MTWRCPKCGTNRIEYRSRTRDYRCGKCGHLMSIAPVAVKNGQWREGRQPKYLRRVEA